MENAKSLNELYDEAKRVPRDFIARCAKVTRKSEGTVRAWLSGAYVPDELARVALANEFGIDPDALFPNRENREKRQRD